MNRSHRRRSSKKTKDQESIHLKAAADRLILSAAAQLTGSNVLVILLNGTTLATGLRTVRPELNYTFYTPEHFFLTTLKHFHEETNAVASPEKQMDSGSPQGAVRLVCAADPPEEEFDSVAFPTSAIGSAEQTQEMLQLAHQRLKIGGCLVVSTNNAKDKWLHERLRELFDRTTVSSHSNGVVYIARKTSPLKKVRDFHAEFAFRLHQKLIFLESVPGVFSHRRVDGGARALIRSLDLLPGPHTADAGEAIAARDDVISAAASAVDPAPTRIAELGCGSGAVSVAAALLFPDARVLAVDSHARAVACTVANARRNQIDRIDVLLKSDAVLPEPKSWDLILTNPPYYSDYRISELFLGSAFAALRPGGRIHLVTKLADWHLERMQLLFECVELHRIGEYDVITGRKKTAR